MLKDKISKEDFFKFLKLYRKTENYVNGVYDATNRALDIINLTSDLVEPYMVIVKNFFTPIENEYVWWYLCEYDKDMMKIYDSKTHEVIADIVDDETLWNFLNSDIVAEGKENV